MAPWISWAPCGRAPHHGAHGVHDAHGPHEPHEPFGPKEWSEWVSHQSRKNKIIHEKHTFYWFVVFERSFAKNMNRTSEPIRDLENSSFQDLKNWKQITKSVGELFPYLFRIICPNISQFVQLVFHLSFHLNVHMNFHCIFGFVRTIRYLVVEPVDAT